MSPDFCGFDESGTYLIIKASHHGRIVVYRWPNQPQCEKAPALPHVRPDHPARADAGDEILLSFFGKGLAWSYEVVSIIMRGEAQFAAPIS